MDIEPIDNKENCNNSYFNTYILRLIILNAEYNFFTFERSKRKNNVTWKMNY